MEFDCGCDNRREIMGADSEWHLDAVVITGTVIIAIILIIALK